MKVTEQAINSILSRWRPWLGLDSQWEIEIETVTKARSWPRSHRGEIAYVKPEPEYFKATIYLNAPAIERSEHELEEILVHELSHVVAWPMSVVVRDALGSDHEATWEILMEQMVETFTRALLAKNADAKK